MLISQYPKNPFSSNAMVVTPAKKKMFSMESFGTASKVIGTNSWLEDTLEGKRKMRDERTPPKDTISLEVHSRSALTKVKK